MFEKILVANRGEIACRIMRTARRMGIGTVAVYSDVDARAAHVAMADEAVHIGGSLATESYLVIERLVEACRRTGSDAVHPGYGFLSERAAFAEALGAAGIAFIGPPPAAIEAMGDKITSKRLAIEAGVSAVPGHADIVADADEAVRIAREVGYPVMIKASAGGGGKGMRIAHGDAGAREGFERSRSEALSSFGDERLFVEKFVTSPRHIEIQVLLDTHGAGVHRGERECSIQRRNQKVIEEAPSPFVDEAMRAAMGEQSLALARAVGYASAGTVEFIVDADRRFYFLEMNTRLQVEHPVTELVTGIDLVESMIRVAAGEPLALTQDQVRMDGWAVEGRVYAEDPYRGFLPSTGRLTRYREPATGALESGVTVRCDAGVLEGGEIPVYYDPMIAKLVAHAPTRERAIDALGAAFDSYRIEGISHNVPFLAAIAAHPRFRAGDLTTAFIDEEFPDGFSGVRPEGAVGRELAVTAVLLDIVETRRRPMDAVEAAGDAGTLPHGEGTPRVVVTDDDRHFDVTVSEVRQAKDCTTGRVVFDDGDSVPAVLRWRAGEPLAWIESHDLARCWQVDPLKGGFRLRSGGMDERVDVVSPRVASLFEWMPEVARTAAEGKLLCPMPGVVVAVYAAAGDEVEAGQALAVVEAMKMENVLYAVRAGTVTVVAAVIGQSLARDEVIMEFES